MQTNTIIFFRIDEAAKLLTISRSRVYELISSGELNSVLIGGRNRRIPASSLERYIAEQTGSADSVEEI
jgi:excisionase family DNA binding protein